jgi:hypothetical protein
MAQAPASAAAMNVGSSSIKFAVYRLGIRLKPLLYGKLNRLDVGGTTLSWHSMESGSGEGRMEIPDREPGTGRLLDLVEARQEFASVRAVGHRVVHGMGHTEATRVTTRLLPGRASPPAPGAGGPRPRASATLPTANHEQAERSRPHFHLILR